MSGDAAPFGTRIAVAAAAVLTAGPLFVADFPPLVDLPQHEALVSILRLWNEPTCGFPAIYELDWFSPYWLGYLAAWALSFPFAIGTAIQLLLAAALVGVPLTTARLVRLGGGDPAWAILVCPLGFGFATSWGFFGFLVAIPLALLLVTAGVGFVREPTPARGVWLALGFVLLFFAHFLAFAVGFLLVAAILTVNGPESVRARVGAARWVRRFGPLFLPAAVAALWLLEFRRRDGAGTGGSRFGWSLERLESLPYHLTGLTNGRLALLALVALLAVLVASGARCSRDLRRWTPFALAAGVVLLGPAKLFGTALMPERFAIFLGPLLLFALDRPPAPRSWRWTAPAALAIALLQLAGVGWRYRTIAREGDGLVELLAGAPAGERLLYLPFERASSISWEPAFAYSGSRYAVGRCGVAEKSFASYGHYPIRFRSEAAAGEPALPALLEFVPHRLRWERDGVDRFGLILVRAGTETPLRRITRDAVQLELIDRRGRWWLYRNPASRTPNGSARPAGREPAAVDSDSFRP